MATRLMSRSTTNCTRCGNKNLTHVHPYIFIHLNAISSRTIDCCKHTMSIILPTSVATRWNTPHQLHLACTRESPTCLPQCQYRIVRSYPCENETMLQTHKEGFHDTNETRGSANHAASTASRPHLHRMGAWRSLPATSWISEQNHKIIPVCTSGNPRAKITRTEQNRVSQQAHASTRFNQRRADHRQKRIRAQHPESTCPHNTYTIKHYPGSMQQKVHV